MLGSLGGVQLLFPILEQASLEVAQRDAIMASQSPNTDTNDSGNKKTLGVEDDGGGDGKQAVSSPSRKSFRGVGVAICNHVYVCPFFFFTACTIDVIFNIWCCYKPALPWLKIYHLSS